LPEDDDDNYLLHL